MGGVSGGITAFDSSISEFRNARLLTRRASDQARYIVRAGGLREIDAGGPASLENFG